MFDINQDAFHFLHRKDMICRLKDWVSQSKPTCLIHPHGFFVILLRKDSHDEWRLHVWPRGTRQITGMPAFIHTHNCYVESRIFSGRLVNKLYNIDYVMDHGHPLYEVVYNGDRYNAQSGNSLIHRGVRISYVESEVTAAATGCVYHVSRNAWHEAIVPSDTMTITVARMYNRSNDPVLLVGKDGYPSEIEFRRTHYPVDHIEDMLRSIE